VERQMMEDVRRPSETEMEKLRQTVRRKRDLELEIQDIEERLKGKRDEVRQMEGDVLPALFMEVGVDHVGIPAEGNIPGYDARLKPYYRANISGDWDEERQSAGFQLLEKLGAGDMIKTVIEVRVGRGQAALANKIIEALRKLGAEFTARRGVPWNSLTAFVKERYQRGAPMGDADLRALGATVGTVVRLTARKED
jgi:hypothetical protein